MSHLLFIKKIIIIKISLMRNKT